MRNLTKRVVVSSHAFSVLWPAGALPPLLEYPPTALWELSRKWDERKVGPTRGLKGVCAWSRRSGKRGRPCVETDSCRSPIHTPPTLPPLSIRSIRKIVSSMERYLVVLVIGESTGMTRLSFFFFPFSIDFLVVPIVRTLKRDAGSIHRSNGIYPSIRYISYERTCVRRLVEGKLSLRQIDSSRRDS